MGTARDIALIFLGLEALVMALLPLLLVSALAYGIYRLRKLVRQYLIVAQGYAQQVHTKVTQVSAAVANPLIQAHAKTALAATIAGKLISRRL